MKLKQFIFAFVAVLLCSVSSVFAQNVAKIGETEYATLQDAIDAAEPGAEVTLLMDITLGTYVQGKSDAAITINKAITLDGGGKTFTSKAGRAININVAGEVVIKNLTIKQYCGRNGNDQKRCINVINQSATVEIIGCTLEMVEHFASGRNLTSYVAGVYAYAATDDTKHNITIDGCTIKTIYGVAVYAAGSEIDIKNSDISNALYAAWINAACDIDVENSTITTEEYTGTNNLTVAFLVQASGVSVTADENTTINVPAPKGADGTQTGGQGYAVYSQTSKDDELDIDISQATVNKVKADDPVIYLSKAEAQIYREGGTVMFYTLDEAIANLTADDDLDQLKSLTGEEVSVEYVNAKLEELGKDFYYTEDGEPAPSKPAIDGSGTWGGIDWTLYEDGLLVIAPTAGEPVPDKNAPTKRTYEVGEWRETVIYKSNGSASAIGGAPYDMNAVKKLIIEEGVTKIGSFTCQFPNLTGEVVIPSTVTYFGQEAFHKAPMTSLVFAAGGTESLCIANGVFKKTLIEEVSFPGDRPSIEIHHWAFGGCPNLKSAHLTANITKVWGGEHVDYFDNFNSQTNVSWTNSSMLFTGCTLLETVTFEDETIRDLFFAHDNGVNSYKNGAYNGDYIQAYIGLTAYNTLQAAINAANEGDVITMVKSVDNTFAPTEPIVVNKAVTINGNGKTFTSKADDCAFKLENDGAVVKGFANSVVVKSAAPVVMLGDGYYPTITAAASAANDGDVLTLSAGEYSEDININKNITLKGATSEVATFAARTQSSNAVTYTGKMVIGNVTTTVENVNFVKGYIDANTSGQARQLTIKNCNFDGVDKSIGYAITQRHGKSIVIENCTAKNYSTGMLYIPQSVTGITVKDVAVENVAAAFNIQYSGDGLFDNVTISEATYGLHVGNYGARTFTLKDCTADIEHPIYIQNNGTANVTFAFEGNNDFGANNFALKGYGVLQLADGATVKAADGLTFAHTKGEGYVVKYNNGTYSVVEKKDDVAQIGEQGYESLAAAIAAAQAGQTITFVAAVTEDVTVNKNVTIDGANNTYTGQMKLTANATIKNVNFDGKGNYSEKYAIVTDDAYIVNVADCTAKSYMGFLNIASNNDATTVKNVTVSEVAYGIKVDYSNDVTIENADITASSAAVLNSNYGNKTITIKDSELNILGTWTRNSTIKTNYLFAGANSIGKFIIDAAIDNFKLAAGATLTAPNTVTVTTDVEGYDVAYADGAYSVVEQKNYVAKIRETGYETFVDAYVAAKDGDTIELLADVTVPTADAKINSNYETAMFEIRKVITIDGNGHTMTADAATATNKKHTLHIHTSGVKLKNVIIDNVGKTKNVNVYCAQNVIFDNVQIINASKGSAALTINNSTVITKTAFAALGNSTAIELGIGKNITAQNLELVVEEGTVFDLGGKSVTLTNNTAKVTTAGNAVDANGNPYFAAYDTSKLYTVAQLKSKADSWLLSTFSNGLTFVGDATLDFDLKVKGTLDLNGHHITIADNKKLTAGGNLTINGNGKLGVKTIDKGWYTITIEDGAYGIDVTQYCPQGYASLPDLNGYYVVGAKPTAQVNDLGGQVIAEEDYMVYGGSKSGDMPLSFVMQFLANQTDEDMETSPYADWFADFVITFEGLEDDFVADGCYLAGYYGEFGWVKVPVDGMTVKNGERYPVMLGVGMGQKYDYICSDVKDFRCAMFLTPEVLAANPNISVKLELAVVDNSKASEGALEALVNNEKIYVVGEYTYTADDFKSPVVDKGTWGGIDWTLTYDGTLTIAPTTGTPTTDNSGKWTYEVGQWPEAVRYNANGGAAEIALWPYDLLAVKSLVIEEGVTSIGSFAARGFKNLTGEVVIPSTVTYIGQEAFQFSTMTKVTFAEGGTGDLCIAQGAFKNLVIEEIALPADRPNVHLHAWVFQNCHYLKNVTLPANVRGVTGTNHVDYNHNANAQTGGNAGSCAIFADTKALETITFGSEDVKNLYFSKERGNERIVATVGLTSYSNLATATEVVNENGGTITMNNNATLAATWTIPAGKEVTLDLNGKTVSMNTAEAAVAALIKNNGTLTIESSVDGGKLSFLATAPSADNAYASNTISNYGTLTINGGTVENLSTGGACYALDNYAGSTANINGGKLTAKKTAVRIFNWTNGEANAAELNVVGGEIISNDGYGININAGNAPYVALNISGGTITTNDTDYNLAVYVVNKNSAENFTANIEGGIFNGNLALNGVTSTTMAEGNVSVTGGTFDGVICYGEPANGFVAGGTFKSPVAAAYCVEGYVCEESESVEGYYDVVFDPTYGKVAMIGDTYYETLAAAITAAKANDVITFIADITEDVTINKDLTIDGAGKTFTGKMTITSNKGAVTIKNVNFDGKGYNGYAVETRGVYYLTVEDCTAKNYGYGFVQNASSTVLTTVKNVTVSDMRYGVKVDYATAVVLENVDITATSAAVLNSNYGEKTITIKNSKLNILATWKRNGTTKTTYVFEGANTVGEFMTEAGLDNFKLEVDATLTAAEGLDVTTDIAHYIVDYTDGTYRAIPDPSYIAELTLVDGEFTDYAPYAGLTVGEFTYQRYFSEYWSPMYLPFQVPVSVFAEAGLEVAYINGVRREDANNDGEFTDDEGFVMELIYIYGGNANGEGKTLKANYPYFVRCKTKGNYSLLDVKLTDFELPVASNKVYDCTTISEKFAISGNYNATSLTVGSNYYMVGADYDTGKAIWSNNFGTSALLPFRFYMQVTERDDYETPVVVSRSMGIAVRGEELPDGTTLIYDVEAEAAEDMIFDLQGRRVLETEKGRIYIKGGKKFIAQ